MASTSYPVATTPTRSRSPAARINTPPTPRLGGFSDNWEPYSPAPPRKSARISSRTTDNRTPSPNSSARVSRSTQPHALANTSAARSSTSDIQSPASHQPSADNLNSPPATLSPQKKRQPASAVTSAARTVSGSLTAQSIRDAAAALGQSQLVMDPPIASGVNLALPTPAKTPVGREHLEPKDVSKISRNLFGAKDQDAPLTVKKSRKKHNSGAVPDGSLDIFADDASIVIFTDSENRVPEADVNVENPFYGEEGITASAVPVRRSPRNKKAVAEKQTVEKNLKREDGLLYIFRGKKVFRKFTDAEAASRATVMPRVLFPAATAKARQEVDIFDDGVATAKPSKEVGIFDDDEEAETDIEEQTTSKKAVAKGDVETPTETETNEPTEEDTATPKVPSAPKHAPASPPSTSRATRSSKKLITDEHTPVKSKGRRTSGGRSPFDGWRRTKNSPHSSTSRKRPGDNLTSDAPKRTRA